MCQHRPFQAVPASDKALAFCQRGSEIQCRSTLEVKRKYSERSSGKVPHLHRTTLTYLNLWIIHENLTFLSTKNQHMEVKIQPFLLCLHVRFLIVYASVKFHANLLIKPQSNKPHSRTPQQTHYHTAFPLDLYWCCFHNGKLEPKNQGKKKTAIKQEQEQRVNYELRVKDERDHHNS